MKQRYYHFFIFSVFLIGVIFCWMRDTSDVSAGVHEEEIKVSHTSSSLQVISDFSELEIKKGDLAETRFRKMTMAVQCAVLRMEHGVSDEDIRTILPLMWSPSYRLARRDEAVAERRQAIAKCREIGAPTAPILTLGLRVLIMGRPRKRPGDDIVMLPHGLGTYMALRGQVEEALIEIGEPAITPLMSLFDEGNEEIHLAAAKILTRMEPEAVQVFLTRVGTERNAVAAAQLGNLLQYNMPDLNLEVLSPKSVFEHLETMASRDHDNRASSAFLLRYVGRMLRDDERVDALAIDGLLFGLLQDTEQDVRDEAWRAVLAIGNPVLLTEAARIQLENFKSPDPVVRAQAAEVLKRELGDRIPAVRAAIARSLGMILSVQLPSESEFLVIAALVQATDDPNPDVCIAATRALGTPAVFNIQSRDRLLVMLGHGDERVVQAAQQTLAAVEHGLVAGELGDLLDDESLRQTAIATLAARARYMHDSTLYPAGKGLGPEDKDRREGYRDGALQELVTATTHGEAAVRAAAAQALQEVGRYDTLDKIGVNTALEQLLADQDTGVRIAAIWALDRLGISTGSASKEVLSGSDDEAMRLAALESLREIAPTAASLELMEQLEGIATDYGESPEMRAAAVRVLARMPIWRTMAALLGRLDDRHRFVRRAALEVLGKIVPELLTIDQWRSKPNPETVAQIKEQTTQAIERMADMVVNDRAREGRIAAAQALARVVTAEVIDDIVFELQADALDGLIAGLQNEHPEVRAAVTEALIQGVDTGILMGHLDRMSFPRQGHQERRTAVAFLLTTLGGTLRRTPGVDPVLFELILLGLLQDPRPGVRDEAWRAVQAIDDPELTRKATPVRRQREVLTQIDILANDTDPLRRAEAARRLGEAPTRFADAAREPLSRALGDDDYRVRIAALRVAAQLGLDEQMWRLSGMLKSKYPAERAAAAEVMGQISIHPGDLKELVAVFGDADPQVQAEAARAVGHVVAQGIIYIATHRPRPMGGIDEVSWKPTEEIRREVAGRNYADDITAAIEPLLELLEEGQDDVSMAAAEALSLIAENAKYGVLGAQQEPIGLTMRERLESEDTLVAQTATIFLGNLGAEDVLEKLASVALDNTNPHLRMGAVTAWERIGQAGAITFLMAVEKRDPDPVVAAAAGAVRESFKQRALEQLAPLEVLQIVDPWVAQAITLLQDDDSVIQDQAAQKLLLRAEAAGLPEEAVPFLIEALDRDYPLTSTIADILIAMEEVAVAPLSIEYFTGEVSAEVRKEIVTILGYIPLPGSLYTLQAALLDKDSLVSGQAQESIATIQAFGGNIAVDLLSRFALEIVLDPVAQRSLTQAL